MGGSVATVGTDEVDMVRIFGHVGVAVEVYLHGAEVYSHVVGARFGDMERLLGEGHDLVAVDDNLTTAVAIGCQGVEVGGVGAELFEYVEVA